MDVAAHRPQEIFRFLEAAKLGRGQQPLVDQLGNGAHLVGVFADPEERVEVAQAALALLQVGLDDVAAVAHALVALVALGELLGDEAARGAVHHLAAEPARRLVVQRLVAPDEAAFQERGANGEVRLRHADQIVQRAAGMADLPPQVPQLVEHRFDHLLAPARLLERGDEGDVDVGEGRHLAAPVAAHRDQRQPRRGGGVADRIGAPRREVVDQAQQLVDQERIGRGGLDPALRGRGEPSRDLAATRLHRALQDLRRVRAQRRAVGAAVVYRGQRIGDRAPIDDRAPVRQRFEAMGHALPIRRARGA